MFSLKLARSKEVHDAALLKCVTFCSEYEQKLWVSVLFCIFISQVRVHPQHRWLQRVLILSSSLSSRLSAAPAGPSRSGQPAPSWCWMSSCSVVSDIGSSAALLSLHPSSAPSYLPAVSASSSSSVSAFQFALFSDCSARKTLISTWAFLVSDHTEHDSSETDSD